MPTIYLEYLFTNLIIDAHEVKEVAIFDVPGTYLNYDMQEETCILLKIEGKFVDIVCEVNPEHMNNVCEDNGFKVIYLQLMKALYGFM